MVRFRPNLVVAGTQPWAEDGWRRVRVGAAEFRVVKGCDRCAIPTTDETTAVRRKEPTYTLAQHRRWDGAVWFGMNLVPLTPGATLHVGDEVEVLDGSPDRRPSALSRPARNLAAWCRRTSRVAHPQARLAQGQGALPLGRTPSWTSRSCEPCSMGSRA